MTGVCFSQMRRLEVSHQGVVRLNFRFVDSHLFPVFAHSGKGRELFEGSLMKDPS